VLENGFASDSDKAVARDLLNSTPAGRVQSLRTVGAGARTLSSAARNFGYGGKIFVEGVGWIENTPQGRQKALGVLGAQMAETNAAAARDGASSAVVAVQPGGVGNLDKAFAPKDPKGKKGPKDQTNQREKRFQDELARLQDEQLRAVADQTQDELERLEIKEQLLTSDFDRRRKDYDLQVKEKQLEPAQADALKKKLNDAYNQQLTAVRLEKTLEAMKRTEAAQERSIDAQTETLNAELAIATTAAERRRIETRLLELARQRETIEAQAVIDRADAGDPSVSTVDLQAARNKLKTQDTRFADQQRTIDRQNRGPLADYLATLPRTVDQVDEALQRAAANGLQQLDDGLTSAVAKFLHLHGLAGQFLQDLIKIGIEREIIAPLADMLFPQQSAAAGSGGGGGIASIISAIGSLFGGGGGASSAVGSYPGFATGVTGVFGGRQGVDTNILSLNGQPFARVNRGEPFAIGPNIGAANGSVRAPSQSVVVVQPIHADFTGARTDEQTMKQFMSYADARSRQAYEAAVRTAAGQAPGVIAQAQTLKG
jgi:hypothetical protein